MTIMEGLQQLKSMVVGLVDEQKLVDFKQWVDEANIKTSFIVQFLYENTLPMVDVIDFLDVLNISLEEILEGFVEVGVAFNTLDFIKVLDNKYGKDAVVSAYKNSSMNDNIRNAILTDYYGESYLHTIVNASRDKQTKKAGTRDLIYAYIDSVFKEAKQSERLLLDNLNGIDNEYDVNIECMVKEGGVSIDNTMSIIEYLESKK